MRKEINALQNNSTWEIIDKARDKRILKCTWIFSIKYKADGKVNRYKVRLVAKEYTQTYRIEYKETFAPVAMMKT